MLLMINYDYLRDKSFLAKLDAIQHRETFAKVTVLTWDELPIENIEGKITGGSISINGSSALRRTCSVTLATANVSFNTSYWGLNTKFYLEVGIKNPQIDSSYQDEILWFPQGIYVLTSFSTSKQAKSCTVSLSGKDKMCLLNGDLGGQFTALGGDLSIIDEYDPISNSMITKKIPIITIIKDLLVGFCNENIKNIIISDLDAYGYELMDYYGDTPLYLLKKYDENIYLNLTLKDDIECWKWEPVNDNWPQEGKISSKKYTLADIEYDSGINQASAKMGDVIVLKTSTSADPETGAQVPMRYTVRKLQSGDTVGYRLSDLVYAGELQMKAGETATSVLDKIVKMLGNFEYYYNEWGQFIFQEKKNNLQGTWSNIVEGSSGLYVDPMATSIAYSFIEAPIITAIQHSPQLQNLKNDYSVWGKRKLPSGVETDVHLRCALEVKPVKYVSVTMDEERAAQLSASHGFTVSASPRSGVIHEASQVDWRELIYQMALDYYAYGQLDDFKLMVAENNPDYYPSGVTGYESFYMDLQANWRYLYDPNPDPNAEDSKAYGADGWRNEVYFNPAVLPLWFEFYGEGTDLEKYSISNIGSRPKVINDNTVTAIYHAETPDILFISVEEYINIAGKQDMPPHYTIIALTDQMKGLFTISSQGKTAYRVFEEALFTHTGLNDSITITCLPIYHLSVNTRIELQQSDMNINGEYIISKITLPLTYNGTMQITASKAETIIY